MRVILLGPQRRPTLDAVVRPLGLAGPFATVTAGWQEREPDDGELGALLGGRAVNLGLYRRWLDVQERDPEYAAAERALPAVLGELAGPLPAAAGLRAAGGVRAAAPGRAISGGTRLLAEAVAEAIAAVRELDAAHLAR